MLQPPPERRRRTPAVFGRTKHGNHVDMIDLTSIVPVRGLPDRDAARQHQPDWEQHDEGGDEPKRPAIPHGLFTLARDTALLRSVVC